MSPEQARNKIERVIPKTAKILSLTDYNGHYIFAIDDKGILDNYLAVDKKTGGIKNFDPWLDKTRGYFEAAERQNS